MDGDDPIVLSAQRIDKAEVGARFALGSLLSSYIFAYTVQLGASITTLLGVYYGTTTLHGGLWYTASQVLWWMIMIRDKLWGLLPLNIAMSGVLAVNLWKVIYG